MFFSARKKIGYKEGQIPAMALGLFTVEFRLLEKEGTEETELLVRRAGSALSEALIVDAQGNQLTIKGVPMEVQKGEKIQYLIQLERIKYMLQMCCPSRAGSWRGLTLRQCYQTIQRRHTN